MSDLIVVGAGIVGASVAYHAAARGLAVTLVDRARPGAGVTADSFAWIGDGGPGGERPGPAAALRRSVTADYRRLEAELDDVRVAWSGSVSWWRADEPPRPPVDAAPDARPVVVDAQMVAALEPHLREPPPWAVYAPGDGAVDPVAVTDALVRGARDHGGAVRLGTTVHALHVRRRRVVGVETSAGVLHAGTVVLAAGVDVARLCAPLARFGLAVPVAPSPAVLVRCAAPPGLVRTVVSCPAVEVRQGADGGLLAAVDYHGESTPEDLARTAHHTVARIVATFRGADSVRVRDARVGLRPMPADGAPIIGSHPAVPGLYLAVMHAGIQLAPVAGRLIAAELASGQSADALSGCRVARFGPGVG